ncbi:hypothetical protein [Tepidibacter thalassicus]|uniref:Uncharacterized protein n=1 Tax=Tepidibacter thalassicus DSM 15285 TaxID=1123350 RepID=A0A1M5SYC8_9FIRM|nr:hypothetical protein [Tepidibacter thalassicus]SHH43360.1 hypothetical protein SAMN02744040_01961 [Tepidibacter thalassicus DSM 15285]
MRIFLELSEKRMNIGGLQLAVLKFNDVEEIKRVHVRVRLYDPNGKRYQLFNESTVVFPDLKSNILLPFEVKGNNAGFYRYDVKIWDDGMLRLTETVENDHFYVDDVKVVDLQIKEFEYQITLKNLSLSDTYLSIYKNKKEYRTVKIEKQEKKVMTLPIETLYIRYANEVIDIKKLAEGGNTYLRHHNLFWRCESENEVFVYDPKAEGKRRLKLKGYAKYLWDISDGVISHVFEPEEMNVMEKIMEYGIIKKLD